MTSETAVAALSAIAGVAGAVVAWLQAVRTTRLKADTEVTLARIKAESEIELERLRAESDRQRKLVDQVIIEARPVEEALACAWQEIQTLKEEIDRVISVDRHDLDLAVAALKPVVEGLVGGYGRWGHQLPEPARVAWHSAKSSAAAILLTLQTGEAGDKLRPRYRAHLIRKLKESRLRLTDQQMVLSSARISLRDVFVVRARESQ